MQQQVVMVIFGFRFDGVGFRVLGFPKGSYVVPFLGQYTIIP